MMYNNFIVDYIYIYFSSCTQQGQCRFNPRQSVLKISSWNILPAGDERALQAAVATNGPIAACLNASPYTFQLYG